MPIDIWHEVNDEPQPRTKIALATSLVVFLGSACASSAGWLGPTNADVSQKYPTPLTPASWAFGIWSIIFILQTIGVGIVLLGREDPDGARQRHANAVSGPWVGGWLSASAWQVAFVQETPLSMWVAAVLLSISLACLVTGLVRLYRQRRYFGSPGSVLLYAAFFLPTSVMAAWLSVATALQFLIACSTQVQSLDALASALAILATGGGLWAAVAHKDSAYGLTLLWAFVAVFEGTDSIYMKRTTVIAIAILLLGFITSVLRRPPADEAERRYLLQSNGSV